MAFDLHITIPENSPAGQVVQRLMSVEHVTPEQAVTRILTEAANQQGKKTPAEEMLGAFSSDEDSAITDEAMKSVREMRQTTQLRDFGVVSGNTAHFGYIHTLGYAFHLENWRDP